MFKDDFIKVTMNRFWKSGTIRDTTARKNRITGRIQWLHTIVSGFKSTREYDYHSWDDVPKNKRHLFNPQPKLNER